MTIQEARNKFISYLETQLGYHEGENNWNKYANSEGLQGLYGWYSQNQPWCDIFYDAAMIECFGLSATSKMTYQPLGQGSAACKYSAGFYSAHEALYDTPEPGDQIFFYDSNGEINHTGAVEKIVNGFVYTIEGNSSDEVRRRTYVLGSSLIAGYGRPDWSIVAEMDSGDLPEQIKEPRFKYHSYTYKVQTNLLKKGDYGPQVANMQFLLNGHGFDVGKIDGKFGDKTYNALKEFQKATGISVDGEWGGESFATMWNYSE